jgi:hypothetical protein
LLPRSTSSALHLLHGVGVSAAYQAVRERDLILTLIKEQSREQTEAYFDGLNMLMLTGKMDARDTLRGISRARPRGGCPHRAQRGGEQAVRGWPPERAAQGQVR